MKLYVGNLSFSTTEEALQNEFSAHGQVEEVAVITDRDTGRPRGFAFVTMNNDDEARAAIEGLEWHGDGWPHDHGERSPTEEQRRRRWRTRWSTRRRRWPRSNAGSCSPRASRVPRIVRILKRSARVDLSVVRNGRAPAMRFAPAASRSSGAFGQPFEAVSPWGRRRSTQIVRACQPV